MKGGFDMKNLFWYLSQSLFSWIHLSYKRGEKNETFRRLRGLNPYFPGFIFLIASSGLTSEMYCTVSQSLFSWIHLSYKGGDRMKRISVHPVSILIFLDSSFLFYRAAVAGNTNLGFVSILIFLDSSFLCKRAE